MKREREREIRWVWENKSNYNCNEGPTKEPRPLRDLTVQPGPRLSVLTDRTGGGGRGDGWRGGGGLV